MNLTLALRFLVSKEPNLFPSTDRYGYRISNAFDQPMATSLNSGASEAKASQILEPGNVKRVVEELEGCGLVVLCGRKAQLLTKEIERAGMTVVHAWHTGNRALIAKYQGEDVARASTALARQELRVQKWAKDLLVAIRAVRAA
ncbi:hypothetical protein [Hydrogenophaga sp. NH-16]|uniref:hypothetical protein n=1 Tax=Hydrogenophaga sp. NH-16 TaxID=2184519 RepID=UPI0013E2B679|nr:hypothetical protein [Hydrogenophaga sp. NH-16]